MANLSREELLRIARGDDPQRRPLWNGMPRISTPLERPKRPEQPEGQLFDFLLPYPINVFDDSIWPALHVKRPNLEILLLKPLAQQVSPREDVSNGNETPDLFVTTFPALVERNAKCYPLHHKEAFSVIAHAARWIRVLTRQYWVGSGTAGIAAQYRGSTFRVEGRDTYQRNYAHYGQTTLVKPLKREIWEALVYPVEEQAAVPVSHSLFCDALTSFAVGDTVSALVQLGVACEIGMTNLLDDLAEASPNIPEAKEYTKARHDRRDTFGSKLSKHSVALGLTDPRTFHPPEKPSNWADLLLVLYGFRNKAAHEGRALIKDKASGSFRELQAGELQSFIFAAEALFRWIWDHRVTKFGKGDTPIPVDGQIIATVGGIKEGGGFVLDTGESHSTSTA